MKQKEFSKRQWTQNISKIGKTVTKRWWNVSVKPILKSKNITIKNYFRNNNQINQATPRVRKSIPNPINPLNQIIQARNSSHLILNLRSTKSIRNNSSSIHNSNSIHNSHINMKKSYPTLSYFKP